MILVCGGLADGVTELVCARLEHCGYPYRLLDLAHYPAGYRVAWRWTDAGPCRHHRRPRLDPRSRRDHAASTSASSAPRAACRRRAIPMPPRRCGSRRTPGSMALLGGPALPGGQPHRRRDVEQQQALPGAAASPRRPQRAGDAGHQRPGRRPRLPGRARRGDLQVGQRHPLDRPPSRPGPARSPRDSCVTARPSSRPSFPAATSACTRSATRSSPPGSRPRRWTTATPISTGSTSR